MNSRPVKHSRRGVSNKHFIWKAVAAITGAILANSAKAGGDNPQTVAPPAYTDLSYDEDYSYLIDPAQRTDAFDPLKYIPLSQKEDWYLSLGGEARDRYENFQNYLFGSGPQSPNGYNLLRVMAHADVHLGPYVRVFTEGISATEQDRLGGARSSDQNNLDVHQAFLDLTLPLAADTDLTIRGGRQVITFGAQRLIGVSDFTNVRRTFDGVRGTLTTPHNTLDVFYARPVRILPNALDDDTPDTFIAGIYDTWKIPHIWEPAKPALETYVLYVDRQSNTFNRTTAHEKRYTFGFRFTAKPKPFDFDIEPDYQAGTFNGQDTRSFSVAAIGGYTLEHVPFTPRFFTGFDIASGGQRNSPGDAFDQLFPSGHDKFGIIDAIGRQNIIDVHPGFNLTLLKNKRWAEQVTLLTQYRQFWRESTQDAVYTSSGSILRAGASGARSIGGEMDFQANWQIDRHVSAYAGYCHFFPGAFIAATGPDKAIDFAYSAVTFTF